MNYEVESKKRALQRRFTRLKNERSSWDAHCLDISKILLPRTGRFFVSDRNRGEKRHNAIYDNTATRALNVLAAGLQSGMSSASRPWFRLTTSDAQLDESHAVKAWLADVTRVIQMIFNKSNTYRALHQIYMELGAYGTASSVIRPNFDTVLHHHPLTFGEFAIATNALGQVDTLYREFDMTVGQMVGEFGKDAVSSTVRGMYERGSFDEWVTIIHGIEPRAMREEGKRDVANMPFKSCYAEAGGDGDKLLRESGFREFPAVCPRWSVSGGDIYGNSPGMEALGDIRQLQHQQLRKAEAIDYKTKPPLQAPTSMKGRDMDTLPGGISFVDSPSPGGGLRTAWDVQLDLNHLLADIEDVRSRIRSSFFVDVFLSLFGTITPQMTATEVAVRQEERMLMLGDVLEGLHNELLSPLIDIAFSRMIEANIVPPAPEELQGMPLNVEFVSMLAQAQRSIATNGVDRFVANLGVIAQMKPDVLDKLDADRWADAYGDMLGIDPELIVPGERVALVREQRAQAMQQQAMQETLAMSAKAARDLASSDTGGKNLLTDVAQTIGAM